MGIGSQFPHNTIQNNTGYQGYQTLHNNNDSPIKTQGKYLTLEQMDDPRIGVNDYQYGSLSRKMSFLNTQIFQMPPSSQQFSPIVNKSGHVGSLNQTKDNVQFDSRQYMMLQQALDPFQKFTT